MKYDEFCETENPSCFALILDDFMPNVRGTKDPEANTAYFLSLLQRHQIADNKIGRIARFCLPEYCLMVFSRTVWQHYWKHQKIFRFD